MTTLFAQLGIQYVDHVAVCCESLSDAVADYLAIPGSRLIKGPVEYAAKGISYAFVQLPGAGMVEILMPLEEGASCAASPLAVNNPTTSGAHHICYAVNDIHHAITNALQFQAQLILVPQPDNAFDGREVAFLSHPQHGLFELVQAAPVATTSYAHQHAINLPLSNLPPSPVEIGSNDSASSAQIALQNAGTDDELDRKLLSIFNKVFSLTQTNTSTVTMDNISQWDSFQHLLLTMEIEKAFDVNINAVDLAAITQLSHYKPYLAQHSTLKGDK